MIDTPIQPSTNSQNGHMPLSQAQEDANARHYIQSLQGGEKPLTVPQVGKWLSCCVTLQGAYDANPDAFGGVLKSFINGKVFPGLDALMAEDGTGKIREVDTATMVPPLSPRIKAFETLAHKASPTLDLLISYLDYWCTRSYEGYTQAAALWVLATVAARRLQLKWRHGGWTPLYIVLAADSTAYAKTEAAVYGEQVIKECGLGFLLTPDDFTPQSLVKSMAHPSVPPNYGQMEPDRKEYLRLKAAFSGQKGWVYDEIGNKMQNIINGRGPEAVLYQLMKKLYDCKEEYASDTIGRGLDDITMPYLTIIGTATPSCLRPIVLKHKEVFEDGYFARIAFVVPPYGTYKTKLAPKGYAVVPGNIISKLRQWHERLGIPECQIVDVAELEEHLEAAFGDKKRGRPKDHSKEPFQIDKGALPQTLMDWSDQVYAAFEDYNAELIEIANRPENGLDERFKSTYGRLAEKALRIAMLLASLEGYKSVEMQHWARGQQIVEQWRRDYHELIAQLYRDEETETYGETEDLIAQFLAHQQPGVWISARDITQRSRPLKNIGAPKLREMLDELCASQSNQYVTIGEKKSKRYRLKTKEEREEKEQA